MGNQKRKTMKGFTLLEMIIAIGILVIMSTAVAGTFASGFSTYGSSRELQRNLETAQYAMNTLEKFLRTSTIIATETSLGGNMYRGLYFYDYSSGRCFHYVVDTGMHELKAQWADKAAIAGADASDDPLIDCDAYTFPGSMAAVTTGYVDGRFHIIRSSSTSSPKRMGRVTVNLSVKESATSTRESHIQASASSRDYTYVGF